MKIGYACLQKGVYDSGYKTCSMKNANEGHLIEIIGYNLKQLNYMIDYNIKNNIKLFRVSSDIVPFGSSVASNIDWEGIFKKELLEISRKVSKNGIRLSVHPGQYTVLNSNDSEVVKKSILDLEYHLRLLRALGTERSSKMVLHIGGVYGDKQSAMERFIDNYMNLNDELKDRIVIENDHRSYNIEDVLYIGNRVSTAVVFDNLHHEINPPMGGKSSRSYILEAGKTWKKEDGTQKIHYSQDHGSKVKGSHSDTIDLDKFSKFYRDNLYNLDYLDIMLEVKDKNLSAIKVSNLLFNNHIKYLEEEWSRYKYSVLEHSPKNYMEIRKLLKDKNKYPIIDFYSIIDNSLAEESSIGVKINGIEHIWGYFKNQATTEEINKYNSYIERFKKNSITIKPIKKYLLELSIKYNEDYLIDSYYFYM